MKNTILKEKDFASEKAINNQLKRDKEAKEALELIKKLQDRRK